MKTEERAYISWSHMPEIGPIRFNALLKKFGSAERAFHARANELRLVLPEQVVSSVITAKSKLNVDVLLEKYCKLGITVITRISRQYPKQLLHLYAPPLCLYVKGNASLLTKSVDSLIGVVGTRKASSYGLEAARSISRDLTAAGMSVISGLALGVDAESHTGCIEAGGTTIAVLGNGVEIRYPYRNRLLYQRILDTNGALVSEYPPFEQARSGMFVVRNRLISGLSRAVVMVEGPLTSGAMATVKYAVEQNKDVFAVPGLITSENAAGPNSLIKNGAHLITSSKDILDMYGLNYASKVSTLSAEEQTIIQILRTKPCHVEDLSISLDKSIAEVLSIITMMELEQKVRRTQEGTFQACM